MWCRPRHQPLVNRLHLRPRMDPGLLLVLQLIRRLHRSISSIVGTLYRVVAAYTSNNAPQIILTRYSTGYCTAAGV